MNDFGLEHGRRLARFAVDSRSRALPDAIALKAKLHIVDTLAAIVSGSALEAGIAGQRYAAGHAGGVASILGTRLRALLPPGLMERLWTHGTTEPDPARTDVLMFGSLLAPLPRARADGWRGRRDRSSCRWP